MKRDMDLIRQILLAVESHEHGGLESLVLPIDGQPDETIGYHCYLLVNAGLADGASVRAINDRSPKYFISNLTWAGHEFLDAARNESLWQTAKRRVSATTGAVSVTVLTEVLSRIAKEQLGMLP